jgi:AcrR family transcriptional regulator
MAYKPSKQNLREDILEKSIPLFAEYGYDGMSMRKVAKVVGVTVAALYYHFSDKEQLYLDVVEHACREKTEFLKAVLESDRPPWERLETFFSQAAGLLSKDKDLVRLMQWVLLDQDGRRMTILVDNVFKEWFVSVHNLAMELGGGYDASRLALSIMSLVFFPFVSVTAHRFLPDYYQEDNPGAFAWHLSRLLRHGLSGGSGKMGDLAAIGNGIS